MSASNVWAVGSFNAGNERHPVFETLVIHWNGSRWAVVASPNLGNSHLYGGVSSTAGADVWAVGRGGRNSLIEHWNGSRWTIVSSPSPGTRSNELLGVTAVSRRVAFAVGYRSDGPSTTSALILRWNGTAWRAM